MRHLCRVPTLWDDLARAGRDVAVVNWPATYPPHDTGAQVVSDRFFHAGTLAGLGAAADPDVAKTMVAPAPLADELWPRRVDPRSITRDEMRLFVPGIGRVMPTDDPRLPIIASLIARTRTAHRSAMHIVERDAPQLLVLCFDAPALACRHFMDYHDPCHPTTDPADAEAFGSVIGQTFRLLDDLLGQLLDAVGDDWDVFLFSDHGHHTTPDGRANPDPSTEGNADLPPVPIEPAKPTQYQRPDGMFVCAGPSVIGRDDPVAASLVDIRPTVLAWLGHAPVEAGPGRVIDTGIDTTIKQVIKPTPLTPSTSDLHGDSERVWRDAVIVDDLLGLDLLMEPAGDARAFRDLLLKRELAMGLQAVQAQDHGAAADHLSRALHRSDHFQTQLNLARSWLRLGRHVEARTLLDLLAYEAPRSEPVAMLRSMLPAEDADARGGTP